MSGGSREHINIVASLTNLLLAELEDTECEVYPSEMRVRTPDTRFYTYPDIAVVSGPPQLEDEPVATLVNPNLIIEVLSPSTEMYDRTRKFARLSKDHFIAGIRACRSVGMQSNPLFSTTRRSVAVLGIQQSGRCCQFRVNQLRSKGEKNL